MKVLGVTGHRPQRLGVHTTHDFNILYRFAVKVLKRLNPQHIITGMALGWDQAIAEAAIVLNIPFTAAVPFVGQETVWKSAYVRERYHDLLARAATVHVVSKGGYSAAKMMDRNLWIVDNSTALLALWDGDKLGGTWNAVQAAEEIYQPVENVWDEWRQFSTNHRLTRRAD